LNAVLVKVAHSDADGSRNRERQSLLERAVAITQQDAYPVTEIVSHSQIDVAAAGEMTGNHVVGLLTGSISVIGHAPKLAREGGGRPHEQYRKAEQKSPRGTGH
jgi:hypothetical protein